MGEPAVTLEDKVFEDEFGKRTKFRGTLLASTTTDAEDRPQWAEMEVWKTEAGAYVVHRKTSYRYRHLSDACPRFGLNILPRQATELDTFPCPRCNRREIIEPGRGYGQEDRSAVDIARTPVDLIRMLANRDGTYSNFVRATLADICEQDDKVAELWLEEVVP
jgi:hypothetical protein